MAGGDRFLLELPPVPAYVVTARLFAAAVARFFEVDEDAVDDLKLAVSEACGMAIRDRAEGSGSPLQVAAERGPDGLVVEVLDPDGDPLPGGDGEGPDPTPEAYARSVGLDVIRSLFENVRIEHESGRGRRIAFSLGLE